MTRYENPNTQCQCSVKGKRRRKFWSMIRRVLLGVVIATLLAGQAVMMKELGIYNEHADLFQIAGLFIMTYSFLPPVRYLWSVGQMLVRHFQEAREGAA